MSDELADEQIPQPDQPKHKKTFVLIGIVCVVLLAILNVSYWAKLSPGETISIQVTLPSLPTLPALPSLPNLAQVIQNFFGKKKVSPVEQAAVSQADTFFKPIDVPFTTSAITFSPDITKPFTNSDIANLSDVEKKYGVTFSPQELARLASDKFVVKNILDTNLTKPPNGVFVGDTGHELTTLYSNITGSSDYKNRTAADTLFITSDGMTHLYSLLSVELLKEAENTYLYPQLLATTKTLYESADKQVSEASSDAERLEWSKVRGYFAIPYALLSSMVKPVNAVDFWKDNEHTSVEELEAQFKAKDSTADSKENVRTFISNLHLDAPTQSEVFTDVDAIYAASGNGFPALFKNEYESLSKDIVFKVPFSQFTVRGSYTTNSLRRQYFRAVQWYQQIPFFVASEQLTRYAFHIGELVAQNPSILNQYKSENSLMAALIGEGDDLDVTDYANAVSALDSKSLNYQQFVSYLGQHKPPAKIKSIPAFYAGVGTVSVDQVLAETMGMRFLSQRFIPDGYWTSQLTQGDEKPAVNGMKLPDQASSLEVMSILGSQYAQTQLPNLKFYPPNKTAIDTKIGELSSEASSWGDLYWQSTQVMGTLWSLNGLFTWQQVNRDKVPLFMQSPLWSAKTLMTGSGFWTELRHTNILYAKASLAERGGGGGDDCDRRVVPPPPEGYVEPQPELYDRVRYLAQKLYADYQSRGMKLQNLPQLRKYIDLLDVISEYTKLELANTKYEEPTYDKSRTVPGDPNCVEHFISPSAVVTRPDPQRQEGSNATRDVAISRTEELRTGIVGRMLDVLPSPTEGSIIPMKDKRMALVVDVHGSKSGYLEEGTGVPNMIFVAVKDANGTRLTAGFTYSHYEFLSGGPVTDENWQDNFYEPADETDSQINYKPASQWPAAPIWYRELLGTK